MDDVNGQESKQTSASGKEPNILRAAIGFAIYAMLTPALLFVSANTVNWPMAWLLTGLALLSIFGSRIVVALRFPDLIRERAGYRDAEDAMPMDKLLVPIVGLFGPMMINIVAGLDHRFGWSPAIPAVGQGIAVAVIVLGYGISVWAMAVNRYFSAVVRVQRERGQVVVTGGPYRWVRHPSYAGGLAAGLAIPFMLEALWALVPTLILMTTLIWRTAMEDRVLMEQLEGYADYAGRTRYRLIPGIW
ncbi:MAG TPA: isoprenylcysteine carboxylmethyltransferase family protein [Anaerolineae bacterium]|nr:isoprenylcysteine carboxylmethyltransferase family protein [Anaerolineae bacterium]